MLGTVGPKLQVRVPEKKALMNVRNTIRRLRCVNQLEVNES